MNLLLDSNIVVPLTRRELKKLNPKIVALLETFQGFIFVSAASLWEIAIKTRLGKLDPLVPLEEIPGYVEGLGFALVDITARHAIVIVKYVARGNNGKPPAVFSASQPEGDDHVCQAHESPRRRARACGHLAHVRRQCLRAPGQGGWQGGWQGNDSYMRERSDPTNTNGN